MVDTKKNNKSQSMEGSIISQNIDHKQIQVQVPLHAQAKCRLVRPVRWDGSMQERNGSTQFKPGSKYRGCICTLVKHTNLQDGVRRIYTGRMTEERWRGQGVWPVCRNRGRWAKDENDMSGRRCISGVY